MHRSWLLVVLAPAFGACTNAPSGPSGDLTIAVAPLALPDIVDACYTLEVKNELGATVWRKDHICADRYGDQRSSVSYIGTCDATDSDDADTLATATVILKIDDLFGPDDSVSPADGDALPDALDDWKNPCAAPYAPDGCIIETTCRENADVAVDFNLTIMRAARQGFFDIAVNFDDLFCSAKVDCRYPTPNGDPNGSFIELVHHPLTGARVQSVVWAFACTDGDPRGVGPNAAEDSTHLYMSDVKLRCGTTEYVVHPSDGPGNLYPNGVAPPAGPLVQAMVFEGVEQLHNGDVDADKLYWNVALGLNTAFFTSTSPTCDLVVKATAANGPFAFGETPADTNYPFVDVVVPINSGAAITCTQHPMDGVDQHGGVTTTYTGSNDDGSGFATETFGYEEEHAGEGVDTHPISTDRCLGVVCTPSDVCHLSACEPTTGACVETENPALPKIFEGTAVVTDQASVDRLACVEEITESFVFNAGSNVASVVLPRLQKIDGSLVLNPAGPLTTLTLPALVKIGLNLDVRGTHLASLDLRNVPSLGALVRFSNNNELVDVNLAGVTTIAGSLELVENPLLETCDLDALTHADSISVNGNFALASLGADGLASLAGAMTTFDVRSTRMPLLALDNLTALAGRLYLLGNTALADVDLSALTSVASQVLISDNTSLATLDLDQLALAGSVSINGNPLLADLGASHMSNLATIAGSFDLRGTQVDHVELPSLTSLGGILYLLNNAAMTYADFPALTSVGNDVLISGNNVIARVDLSALTSVHSFSASGNPLLASLGAGNLANLNTITGAFGMSGTALPYLDLHAVETVAALVQIINNNALTYVDLSALSEITGASDGFYFTGNGQLQRIAAGNLSKVHQINISGNAQLADLDGGFSNLVEVRNLVSIVGTRLTSLDLGNVTNIPNDLALRSNALLTSVDLGALTTVGHDLSIDTNIALTSVVLDALTDVGRDLVFTNNATLSDCDIDAIQAHTAVGRNSHQSGNLPCVPGP